MNNQETPQQNTIMDTVLEKIRAGEIHMTSKAYFRLKVVFLLIIIVGMLITSSVLFSYILFTIKASGQLFFLGFGKQGFEFFFVSFPWGLLLLDILFIFVLEWFLKRFRLGYRYSFSQVLVAMLVVTVILGELINISSIHEVLLHQAEQEKLPIIGGFYKDLKRPPHQYGAFKGTIISITSNFFTLEDFKDVDDPATTTETVVAPAGLNVSSLFSVGDMVFVAGTVDHGQIQAYGIRKLGPNDEE